VFVNKKGPRFFFIITCKNDFIVYHEKLEVLFPNSILVPEIIKHIEFGRNNTNFYVGSDKGKLYKFSIEK
jgi:hypothetical protein